MGALVLAGAALPARVDAWGFTGHRLVNRKAIGALPSELRPLFLANVRYVAEYAVDPDLRRTGGADPSHFLNLDAFGAYPFDGVGASEASHLARFGARSTASGRLPWRVGELYADLVVAFRAGRARRSLELATELGHFVADAHVPFHATSNYDGQLTGQRGLHARWESALVERSEVFLESAVQPAAALPVLDPVAFTLETLRESYLDYPDALASDAEAVSGLRDLAETPEDDRYQDLYYARLGVRENPRVARRLEKAAWAIASLWTRAWIEAGRPTLPAERLFPYVRHDARAILVSLDGAGARLVQDAVARGVMPELAALRARGAVARGSVSTLPTKTAIAHASLFTGAYTHRHGVAGNEVPRPGGSITETIGGYSSTVLAAEPVWVTAARQDLDVTVVSGTQLFPFTPYTADRYVARRLTLFDAYQNSESSDAVYTAALLRELSPTAWTGDIPRHVGPLKELDASAAGIAVRGLLYDDPADPVAGFDTVALAVDGDTTAAVFLKPSAAGLDPSGFAALPVRLAGADSTLFFRLFELSPDGQRLLLYRMAPHALRSNKPRAEAQAQETVGGFVGYGGENAYAQGKLGPTLAQGGDGTAEKRYLETVALATRQIGRLLEFALERSAWDLLVAYVPFPDESLHLWYGHLDPEAPGHDAVLARRLAPHLDQVLKEVDGLLGRIAKRAGPDVVVAVTSDHGMVGVGRVVKPNVALAAAGLLGLDERGRPEPARTQVAYFGGHYFRVNHAALPGGTVRPADLPALAQVLRRTLQGLKDPLTGRPVILEVFAAPDRARTPADRPGADFFLSVAPGYGVSAATQGEVLQDVPPRGDHFLDPERPAMHASFAIAGPGVARVPDLGLIQIVDVVPTLCALLGIEPPAHAEGTVLEKVLAFPRADQAR